jgi:hypothetical protein
VRPGNANIGFEECAAQCKVATGTGSGHFNSPLDVALDCGGVLYVADALNRRVQMFGGAAGASARCADSVEVRR